MCSKGALHFGDEEPPGLRGPGGFVFSSRKTFTHPGDVAPVRIAHSVLIEARNNLLKNVRLKDSF